MKKVYLLGCTGSIGLQTLEVIKSLNDIKVESISFGENIDKAIEIINEFNPKFVSAKNECDALKIKELFPNVKVGFGSVGLINAATFKDGECEEEYLVNSLVGMIGLEPTIAAIKMNRNILLANKETLVVGGEIIEELKKDYKFKLIPIDSEHSAIMQCLKGYDNKEVEKIIITASGGAFRDKSREELKNVTIEDALKHPNWAMGKKITVDCATMVNKGLEVMEAHYLFNMPYDKIDTILHYESIVHSMVEYKDGSIIAQMAKPDMRIPIQNALTYPNKKEYKLDSHLNLLTNNNLSFKAMDFDRYPCLKLAYFVGESKGLLPTVFNSSNEIAVKLFIENKIKFLDIEKIIFKLVEEYKNKNQQNPSLDEIIKLDKDIKDYVNSNYNLLLGKE